MGRVKGKPTGAVKCPNHSHCRDPVPIPGAEDGGKQREWFLGPRETEVVGKSGEAHLS